MGWRSGISHWRNGQEFRNLARATGTPLPVATRSLLRKKMSFWSIILSRNDQRNTHARTLCIKFSDCVDRFKILFMLLAFSKENRKKGVGGFLIHAHRLLSVRKGVAARERGGWWCAGGSAQLQCRGMRQVARAGILWWEVGNIFWKEKRGSGEKTLGKNGNCGEKHTFWYYPPAHFITYRIQILRTCGGISCSMFNFYVHC